MTDDKRKYDLGSPIPHGTNRWIKKNGVWVQVILYKKETFKS